MIDEELYQQAADELNSDRRRPHIWARACALASDDHDEARYLYTNLRVEELIAERDSGIASNSGITSTEVEHDQTLALEPLNFDLDADAEDFGDSSAADDDAIPASISAPSGVDRRDSDDDVLQILPTGLEAESQDDPPGRISFAEQFDQGLTDNADSPSAGPADAEPDLPENEYDRTLGSLPTLNRLAEQGAKSDAMADSLAEELARSGSDEVSFDEFQNSLSNELDAEFDADLTSDANEEAPTGSLSDTLDETMEDLDGTAVLHFDGDELAEFNALADSDEDAGVADEVDDVRRHNSDQLDELLSGVDTPSAGLSASSDEASAHDDHPFADSGDDPDLVLTADFSDASGTQQQLEADDLEWLAENTASNDKVSSLQPYSPTGDIEPSDGLFDDTDRLAQEFERQADELPGQRNDIVAHETWDTDETAADSERAYAADTTAPGSVQPGEEQQHTEDLAAAAMTASDSTATAVAGATVAAAGTAAAITGAAAGARAYSLNDDDSRFDEFPDLPVDVSDTGIGTRYAVYIRGNTAQAVKTGVSWSALVVTLPFLIYRHLFGTAIVYGVLALIVLSGLLVTGLAWLDAGPAASTLIKASTAGFALLTLIGLFYLPFRHGNTWRGEKLERRGYELVAWVRAKNPGKAISEARRAAALD